MPVRILWRRKRPVGFLRDGLRRSGTALWLAVIVLAALSVRPAAAQFSATEGFAADGQPNWNFEVSPYVFLPNLSATVGLQNPAGFDISVNQNRPTVSKLTSSLTGAFMTDNLVRYGDWSGELNFLYVSGAVTRNVPPILPGGSGATLKATASELLVSPGFGYQVLPITASSQVTLDARAGFTYNSVSAGAGFEQSRFGGVNVSTDFVQPWIGGRLSYYPSPDWRIVTTLAATGLGVDGGTIGWNGRLGASYLITSWCDVTLAYAATQTERNGSLGANGQNRSVNILAYGPVLALGFRF
jgi:hypothetical protein